MKLQWSWLVELTTLHDLLTKEGFIVDRKNIKLLADNIKSVGKYEAEITLYKDVKGTITFEVAEG